VRTAPALFDGPAARIKTRSHRVDAYLVAELGTRCASCGAPTQGAYRCEACTVASETAEREQTDFSLAPTSRSTGVRHSPLLFPLGSLVSGLVKATDNGLLPRWLPRTLLILLAGWITFLIIWGLVA